MEENEIKLLDQNYNDEVCVVEENETDDLVLQQTDVDNNDEKVEIIADYIDKITHHGVNHIKNDNNKEESNCNKDAVNGDYKSERRSDEPTELSFEKPPENKEEQEKRKQIETSLKNPNTTLREWRDYAISDYGLINDDLRKRIWPLLAGVDINNIEIVPKLDDLKSHPEYNQVILDVNRSLKRFPPGIPYKQRIALQDQLTVLILRVIMKHPHLKYYQGYHDVAITFLLVVGEELAFHVMEILSTNHLVECMQETMEPTQKRLMFLYPIIEHENAALYNFLQKSSVGTLFALPWYLTWFGHSLNSYRSVVRLYDFFLASPFLLPLYVTAAIVLYRTDEIFKEDCDMASIHCLLSQLPDDLPFEYLLRNANDLYRKYPPSKIEIEVDEMIIREKQQRALEEEQAIQRRKQLMRQRAAAANPSLMNKFLRQVLLSKRSVVVTTAFSILVGLCAYYYKTQILAVGVS